MSLTPEQKVQAEANGMTEEQYTRMLQQELNRTYEGKIIDIGRETWMVNDEGRPPRRGAEVIVNGRKARVIADMRQLTARGKGKFTVQFI